MTANLAAIFQSTFSLSREPDFHPAQAYDHSEALRFKGAEAMALALFLGSRRIEPRPSLSIVSWNNARANPTEHITVTIEPPRNFQPGTREVYADIRIEGYVAAAMIFSPKGKSYPSGTSVMYIDVEKAKFPVDRYLEFRRQLAIGRLLVSGARPAPPAASGGGAKVLPFRRLGAPQT